MLRLQITHRHAISRESIDTATGTFEIPISMTASAGGLVQHRLSAMLTTADSRTQSVRTHGG